MAKRASLEKIEKFRRDYLRLRKLYSNMKIAKKLGIHPGNLSSCVSGKKNPGEKLITKFNLVFQDDLDKLGYEFPNDNEKMSEVNEAKVTPQQMERELIDELKANSESMRSALDKITKANLLLAESNINMSKSNLTLVENNQKLINRTGL